MIVTCYQLLSLSEKMNDIFSIFVIVGIILTFAPQQWRIFRQKSSVGLSPPFMLLGITSVIAQLLNMILMQIPVFEQCRNGSKTCLSDMLGLAQVIVLTLSIFINNALFIIYYPKPFISTHEGMQVQKCIKIFLGFCAFCIALVFPVIIFDGIHSKWIRIIGQSFGVFCTILSCIQYVPQIIKTWTTKHVGALSVATLAIQAPGSYFFAYTLAVSPATDVTTWGSFFISGTFQFILVGLCTYISKHHESYEIFFNVRERTPILAYVDEDDLETM